MQKLTGYILGLALMVGALWLAWPTAQDTNPTDSSSDYASVSTSSSQQSMNSASSSASRPAQTTNGPQTAATQPTNQAFPDPIDSTVQNAPASLHLWQGSQDAESVMVEGFPATRVQTNPDDLATLHVGQELVIDIPGLVQPVVARLDDTHNQLDTVQVFRGPILDREEHDNVIVTRGETATYLIVSTSESVWSAVMDHKTGETLITDERDVLVRQRHGDMIPVPGYELEPPDLAESRY